MLKWKIASSELSFANLAIREPINAIDVVARYTGIQRLRAIVSKTVDAGGTKRQRTQTVRCATMLLWQHILTLKELRHTSSVLGKTNIWSCILSPPRSRYVFTGARRDLYLSLIATPLRNSNLIIRAKSNRITSRKTSRRAMFSNSGHSLLVHGTTRQALKSIRPGRI